MQSAEQAASQRVLLPPARGAVLIPRAFYRHVPQRGGELVDGRGTMVGILRQTCLDDARERLRNVVRRRFRDWRGLRSRNIVKKLGLVGGLEVVASPSAWSRPAVIAIWWPKFRLRSRTGTWGYVATRFSRTFCEPSVLVSFDIEDFVRVDGSLQKRIRVAAEASPGSLLRVNR